MKIKFDMNSNDYEVLNFSQNDQDIEFQHLWRQALKLLDSNRYGIAFRIFEEGIKRAEDSGDYPTRLYQLRRDYADALLKVGEFDKALELFVKEGRYDFVGNLLFSQNQFEKAIDAYQKWNRFGYYNLDTRIARAYFVQHNYKKALEHYHLGSQKIILEDFLRQLRKDDAKAILICLNMEYKSKISSERKQIQKTYPKLYKFLIRNYTNWRSAIFHLNSLLVTENLAKIKNKLMRPAKTISNPILDYEEYEVDTILGHAATAPKNWSQLMDALTYVKTGKYDIAMDKIRATFQDQGFYDNGYAGLYYRDLLIIQTRFSEALTFMMKNDSFSHYDIDMYLNLILLTGRKIDGRFISRHYRYMLDKCTDFLIKHNEEFINYCQEKLDEFEKSEGMHLLKYIYKNDKTESLYSWLLFIGSRLSPDDIKESPLNRSKFGYCQFNSSKNFLEMLKKILTNSENQIREKLGVLKIGEGWVSESEMVSLLTQGFDPYPVIPQGSPKWLGAMRYDAFIPDLKLAVEYQGVQHFKSIDFFGGKKALELTQKRDREKFELSKLNGIHLEYILYNDNISERVGEIIKKYMPSNNL